MAVCARCGSYLCFLPKPESDRVCRPAAHRDLVKRFGCGFCELCMRKEVDLPAGTFLIGHHVLEYQDGGDPKRENVWILCSFCSALVHTMRVYLGHYRKPGEPEAIGEILPRIMSGKNAGEA